MPGTSETGRITKKGKTYWMQQKSHNEVMTSILASRRSSAAPMPDAIVETQGARKDPGGG